MPEHRCWACKSELKPEQIFCTECNNWQGRRRFLNISSLSLSLLIALISVVGALGPAIKSLIIEPLPNLHFSGLYKSGSVQKGEGYFGADLLTVSVANTGDGSTALPTNFRCTNLTQPDMVLYFDAVDPTFISPKASQRVQYKSRFISFDGQIDENNQPFVPDKSGSYKCPMPGAKSGIVPLIINHSENVSGDYIEYPVIVIENKLPECSFQQIDGTSLQSCISI